MAVDQEARDLINDILAEFATRWDGGTWGVPADRSVLVRQEQPPASGSSQFKGEDVPIAANSMLGRLSGDLVSRTFAQVLADIAAQASDADLTAIAAIAAAEGFLRKTAADTWTVHKSKLNATVPPGTTDDSAAGYSVGSLWTDITADKSYLCVDVTPTAAVWNDLSAAICVVAASAPSPAVEGQLWYDTDATGSSVSSTVNQVTKTGDYTLTADDVAVNANGALTLTLPTAVGISGKGYEIKNTGTGLVAVVCYGSETIDEGATAVLHPKASIIVRSDNANWWIK